MALTLTVLRCPDAVTPETRTVSGGEFSIGRGQDNDWTLPDPDRVLSKRHCVLAYRSGGWQIAGISTNGTFLNRDADPIESGPPRSVNDGDRIRVGPYEIEVRVGAAASQQTRIERSYASREPINPFDDDPFAPRAPENPSPMLHEDDRPPPVLLPVDFDPLAPDAPDPDEGFVGPTFPDHRESIADAIDVPSVRAVLPNDWDLDAPAPIREPPPAAASVIVPKPPPPEPPPATSAAPKADLFAAFLRGAGIESAAPPDPERTMEQLGAAFRALVSGLREALIARASVKDEFRIERTMIRRSGNNPLKFSAGDEDALAALLGIGRRTDMNAEAAVTDALADIRLHELATMMAMQAGARALLGRLSPDSILRASERAGGLPIPSARKSRSWDAFEALYGEITRGLSDDFDSVFGKSFARAYEHAMDELSKRAPKE